MSKNTIASLSTDIAALSAVVADLTAIVRATAAPVATAKPTTAKVSAAFGNRTFREYVDARKAAAVPCAAGHSAETCNRTFSPKSSGAASHEARIV